MPCCWFFCGLTTPWRSPESQFLKDFLKKSACEFLRHLAYTHNPQSAISHIISIANQPASPRVFIWSPGHPTEPCGSYGDSIVIERWNYGEGNRFVPRRLYHIDGLCVARRGLCAAPVCLWWAVFFGQFFPCASVQHRVHLGKNRSEYSGCIPC